MPEHLLAGSVNNADWGARINMNVMELASVRILVLIRKWEASTYQCGYFACMQLKRLGSHCSSRTWALKHTEKPSSQASTLLHQHPDGLTTLPPTLYVTPISIQHFARRNVIIHALQSLPEWSRSNGTLYQKLVLHTSHWFPTFLIVQYIVPYKAQVSKREYPKWRENVMFVTLASF